MTAQGAIIAAIWAGALMRDCRGHRDAHDAMLAAIEAVLADPAAPRTPDLGGTAGTADVGRAIAQAIEQTLSLIHISEPTRPY